MNCCSCDRRRESECPEQRKGKDQQANGKAHHHQGMHVTSEDEFAQPRRDLRGAEQRADQHHSSGIDPGALEDRQKMRREARRDKCVSGKSRHQKHEGGAEGRPHRRRRWSPFGGNDVMFHACARQCERMQRRRDEGEQGRIDQICPLPAEWLKQRICRRPTDGGGKAARKRQHRNRLARLGAENSSERRERRIVERSRHGGAQQHPRGEISDRMTCISERNKTGRASQRTERHHAMAAITVDEAADGRRDEPGREQPGRDAAHREGEGKPALGRNQRHGQHGRIEHRAPRQDLRDAEHRDGAPRAKNEFAESGHSGAVILKPRSYHMWESPPAVRARVALAGCS